MVADPDWTDPCAVLEWLRPQYYKVAAGQQRVTVKYLDNEVQYAQASINGLSTLMRQLETECAKKQGLTTGRRRAFTAG